MSIQLYHCKGSRSVRPLWTLKEMQLDHELITMEFPPRYSYAGYKEINPLGTVPCLVDSTDDRKVVMTESSGMCQYLVDCYGGDALAVDRQHPEYGDYLNWLHRSDATLTFPQTLVLRYTILEPEEKRNPQVAEDYRKWFLARMRCVETALQDKMYLCAERFTIADVTVAFAIHLALSLNIDEVLTPNVERYWSHISARPAYQAAIVE